MTFGMMIEIDPEKFLIVKIYVYYKKIISPKNQCRNQFWHWSLPHLDDEQMKEFFREGFPNLNRVTSPIQMGSDSTCGKNKV